MSAPAASSAARNSATLSFLASRVAAASSKTPSLSLPASLAGGRRALLLRDEDVAAVAARLPQGHFGVAGGARLLRAASGLRRPLPSRPLRLAAALGRDDGVVVARRGGRPRRRSLGRRSLWRPQLRWRRRRRLRRRRLDGRHRPWRAWWALIVAFVQQCAQRAAARSRAAAGGDSSKVSTPSGRLKPDAASRRAVLWANCYK